MTKIRAININGIRGIKESLALELNKNSILLYGDNGSGKSSITDAFEWFYKNSIGHLSVAEIGRGGLEALRNIFLNNEDDAAVNFEYTNEKYDSKERIFYKKESIKTEQSNQSEEFKDYLKESQKENLILRYRDLVGFIMNTKKEKLDRLSDIIGFSQVSKVRDTLRKVVGELERDLKRGNFDNQISYQQSKIIEQIGGVITSDDQLVNTVNQLVKSLNIDKQINQIDEIDTILTIIKKPEDSRFIEIQSYYNKISDWASNVPATLEVIEDFYQKYHEQYQKIVSDVEKINKLVLEKLLNAGVEVIKGKVVTDDHCPLCLQPKNKNELLKELEVRLAELEQFKKEKLKMDELKEILRKELRDSPQRLNQFISDKYSNSEENRELKEKIEALKTGFDNYSIQLNVEISTSQKLKPSEELIIDRENLNQINDFCKQKIENLKANKKDDRRIEVYSKLLLSRDAFLDIQRLKKEKEKLERQQQSLALIYSEFLKKQKQAIESFLTGFSSEINKLYQFMNPDERVKDIKLIPLEKDDELQGITLEFKFFKNSESPPQKYLSESHLNCLGIAFFLSSVKAFNKRNRFFILDDVISSFDSIHRKRFADLLIEKFSDYQIILMTHERNWFDLVLHSVRGKGWQVQTVKWDVNKGTYIDEPKKDLKEKIETKITASNVDGLGNDIRKYLEQILKQVAQKQGVKVKFQFNDKNEDRMAYELLSDLESHVKQKKIPALKNNPIIQRLKSSLHIANKESHDSLFKASIGDLKASWRDVEEFESLFF